ncbi:MAG: dihydrolipoyl dehydrogenase family protein, partial [Planctomycetaceae bacterium]
MPGHDLLVIGAGPGGYVAAIRAAQLGMSVGCVEKEPALGGTCLRIGCIPSKALLESSEHFAEAGGHLAEHGVKLGKVELDLPALLGRKDKVVEALTRGVEGLFKKNKIERYQGRARIDGLGKVIVEQNGKPVTIEAKHVLIATGSKSAPLRGVETDGDRVGTSTEALSYTEVPKHLVVIGAGYIGLEMGTVWRRLGAQVTVLEYLDRILPGTDDEIAREAFKIFKKQGLEFRLGSRVTGVNVARKHCDVQLEGGDSVRCDKVLVAVGRQPNTEGLGLDKIGIKTNDRGQIEVDEQFRTSAEGFYAIGDVIPGPMLAHKAEE